MGIHWAGSDVIGFRFFEYFPEAVWKLFVRDKSESRRAGSLHQGYKSGADGRWSDSGHILEKEPVRVANG